MIGYLRELRKRIKKKKRKSGNQKQRGSKISE
jgi:hypothetical protein